MDKPYKSYNLKLDKETYLNLRQIELDFEKNNSIKKTKSEIITILINEFKKIKTSKNQISILE